ncbi:SOS response-associated peptidase [Kozakia baliensis]|uniref:SOS response-associated peptidase n=1 Tax=Kozakia baliensis TaxID=153496 RepID=UPI00087C8318|nr:SOS response-associated peptidase [Kozakia baliensis]AOX20893.1 hypothetical protein A0U90_12070 [Kozakia baliensis]
MCGRYANALTTSLMQDIFQTQPRAPDWLPSWNVAPGQPAPVIWADSKSGRRYLDLMLWGLVPHWAKNMERRPINARAETVATNGMFWAAFRARRCLLPATAYYEWQRIKGHKQPYAFARQDRQPLALAGIWENWEHEGDVLHSFAIVTTQAKGDIATIHDRMPVCIEADKWEDWLTAPRDVAANFLHAPRQEVLEFWPVSARVNTPQSNGEDLLERIGLS